MWFLLDPPLPHRRLFPPNKEGHMKRKLTGRKSLLEMGWLEMVLL
jgi:hypothetical protein